MRRPVRTRRLSTTAIISCAAFLIVSIAGIRSFWITAELALGQHRVTGLFGGGVTYVRADYRVTLGSFGYQSGYYQKTQRPPGILGFVIWNKVLHTSSRNFKVHHVRVPLWPLLLLLLIAPVRWVVARTCDVVAFPVIADAMQIRFLRSETRSRPDYRERAPLQ